MPLNTRKILIDSLWESLKARPAFLAAVKEADRVKSSDPHRVKREAVRRNATGGYPRVIASSSGGAAQAPPTTFKFGSPTTTLDYSVPTLVNLTLKLVHEQLQDDVAIALEAEIEAALHELHIRLTSAGYRWAGAVTWRLTSRDERNADTGNTLRPVSRWAITVQCRPLLSALTATD